MTLVKKLTLSDVTDMIAHFIWVPSLYNTFCNSIEKDHFILTPEHIDTDETGLMYVWEALKDYYDSQGIKEVPDRSRLEIYIRAVIRRVEAEEDEAEMVEERLFGEDPEMAFLPNLYDDARKTLNYESGFELARQFLRERGIIDKFLTHCKELDSLKGWVRTDAADVLKKYADEAARVEALTTEIEIQPLMPELSVFKPDDRTKIVPTGIPWIDARIDDGQRYGEVNGLFGPTGAGKTTLGCQLFISNIREAASDLKSGKDNRFCVFYTYEQSATEVRQEKLISCACHIKRDRVKTGTDFEKVFTRGSERQPYEQRSQLSEYERYYSEMTTFNNHGFIRNMSGVPDLGDSEELKKRKMHAGEGGIDEIVHDLESLIRQRWEKDHVKQGVRAVFIDYMGLVIERQYKEADKDYRWNAMHTFGNEVRMKIAGAFDCTVWLLHQMSGTANDKSPTTPLAHTDAAGCKSLADNMANCLCLGRKDKDTGCLFLNFSKTRHSGNSAGESELVLRHSPLYAELYDVTGKFQADRGTGHFYGQDELD